MNNDIKIILQELEQPDKQFVDPELQQHQLRLTFNTHLIECLEARFLEQNRLSGISSAQEPGAIGKTAQTTG